MSNRLNAFANLATELGSMTVSMGGMLLRASTRRPRTTYYEDSF